MADVVIVQPAPPSYVIVAAIQGPGGAATVAVTGTGFLHATSGTLDPAARAVNLASADVTGTLGVANGGTGLSATGAVGTFLKTVSAGVLGFALLAPADMPTLTLTGDVVGANSGGTIATQVQGIRGVSVPTPPGAGTTVLTDVSGVLSWATAASTSVTGTGLWYSVGGTLNAAAVTHTGDVTQGALSGSNVPLTVTGLRGSALPALAAGVLLYTGLAWGLSTVAPSFITPGTSGQILINNAGVVWTTVTGDTTITAFGVTTTGKINGASVPAAGGLTTGNVLQVTGASALGYAAVNLAGGANFVTGLLPPANLGTITLTGSVTGAASGGTIATTLTSANLPAITLTGDTTGGPTSGGSIATTTLSARGGLVSWAVTTGIQSWLSTAQATLNQGSVSASTQGANFTITPQQSTQATNQGGGSLVVALQPPLGTASEAWLQISRGGTTLMSVGPYPGGSLGGIWIKQAPTSTNYSLVSDGSSLFLSGQSTAVYIAIGNAINYAMTSSGIQLISSGTTTSFGGGVGVIGIGVATTVPSSNPPANGSILFQNAACFGSGQAGLQVRGGFGAVTTIANMGSAGTINTQTQGYDLAWGTCRSVSSATAQTALSYATTTGVSGIAWIYVTAHAVTAGTGVAAGDSAGSTYLVGWRNIAGTVTLWMSGVVAVLGSATTTTATALTPPSLSATVSTNAITFKVANVALCTIDSEIWMEAVLN